MWKDLPEVWQTAFSKGWEAFKHGAVPIGAVITDENGKIIYTGRNHIGEVKGGNNRIAHAETDCLLQLDTEKYPKFKEYTLYACMEPCPMCMGTFVMAGLRTLRVAARDRYCGAVHYINDDPYVNGKNIDATFELDSQMPHVYTVYLRALTTYWFVEMEEILRLTLPKEWLCSSGGPCRLRGRFCN